MKDHLKKDEVKTWCGLEHYYTTKEYFPMNFSRVSIDWYDKPTEYSFLLDKFKCEKCGMNYMKNLKKLEKNG